MIYGLRPRSQLYEQRKIIHNLQAIYQLSPEADVKRMITNRMKIATGLEFYVKNRRFVKC